MVRIDIRHTRQDAVQHLQVRHLQTEKADMFSGTGRLDSDMQGDSSLAIARMTRQDRKFPFMKTTGDIIELSQPAPYAIPVVRTIQPLPVPGNRFGSQDTHRTYRFTTGHFPPQFQQRIFRFRNNGLRISIKTTALNIQQDKQLCQAT